MDPTGIFAIFMLFGGAALVGVAFSPIGRAIAARIRREDPVLLDELADLRAELAEVHERLDFNERMLAQGRASSAGSAE